MADRFAVSARLAALEYLLASFIAMGANGARRPGETTAGNCQKVCKTLLAEFPIGASSEAKAALAALCQTLIRIAGALDEQGGDGNVH